MSTVELRLGDMFYGPSDLIVLPCSTGGTVSSFVKEKLTRYGIEYPTRNMTLGEVRFFPFEGGENIAQFVAYAAAVKNYATTEEAIRRIGVKLGDYTRQYQSVRHIAAPC